MGALVSVPDVGLETLSPTSSIFLSPSALARSLFNDVYARRARRLLSE